MHRKIRYHPGNAGSAGGFTLAAADAVVADTTHLESETIDQVAELVAKSLVAADLSDAEPRFRLLDTTWAYALNKLGESGEVDALGLERCREHAGRRGTRGAAARAVPG